MPKAAYCSECAGYVWLGKDGGCASGHARSCLREVYDAQPNPETGKPLPQFNYPPSPEPPTMREAVAILGTGVASLTAAAGRRMQSAAERLSETSVQQYPGESFPPLEQPLVADEVPLPGQGDSELDAEARGAAVARVTTSGLVLRHSDGRFWLDSVGELLSDEVRNRDTAGVLEWTDSATRDWFLARYPGSQSVHAPQSQFSGSAQGSTPSGNLLIRLRDLVVRAFVPAGRFSRGEYAVIYLGALGVFYILFTLASITEPHTQTPGFFGVAVVLWYLFQVPLIICAGIRRVHDLGHPGSMLLLAFVPLANIVAIFYLLFAPGKPRGTTPWG